MRIECDISIKLIHESVTKGVPISEIFICAEPTGKYIEGALLEAAVQWQDITLLFLTDDIPFEEMLRILMLDKQLNVVDSALIGAPYSTGSFKNLQFIEPDILRFNFIGGNLWEIQLLAEPRRRIPFLSEPRGVSRPFGFFRRFIVRGNPLSENK